MRRRREFDAKTKAEIKYRCKRATGFECEMCHAIVSSGEIDHLIAEELVVDKTKKLTAQDAQFLCDDCHRRVKTPQDQGIIAKAKRREQNDLGLRQKPAGANKLQGRGFQRFEKPRRGVDKSALPPLPRIDPMTRKPI